MIRSWSFSKLSEFEKCKYRTFLLHVKRVPEPERPLPPGKTEQANDRGSRVHDAAEHYVRGHFPRLAVELHPFRAEFDHLRKLFKQGIVSLEEEWGFDDDWNPTDWKTAWHRSKLDIMVHTSPTSAIIIDLKTGRKHGNEMKHGEQLQLYVVDALERYPNLEEITCELWYPDQDEITTVTYSRSKGLMFKASFKRRGIALTTNVDWPPNPNIFTCRYCRYGESGDCKVSASQAFATKGRR